MAREHGVTTYTRYPDDVADALRLAAAANTRTIVGELEHRLRQSLELDGYLTPRDRVRLLAEVEGMTGRLRKEAA